MNQGKQYDADGLETGVTFVECVVPQPLNTSTAGSVTVRLALNGFDFDDGTPQGVADAQPTLYKYYNQ